MKRDPAIRTILLPKDTNGHGTIFGGVILSYIDLAGAVAARTLGPHKFVTVGMDKIAFPEPVYVGDVISFYAEVARVGNTSVTVRVRVEAQRFEDPSVTVKVTEATVTYVAVDVGGRPIPIKGGLPKTVAFGRKKS
ncbi:MAG: acyl-CoA thioesterase [Planctomycetota bacterium]|nr:MAG: acyl-CoA thioesterase [Planctomycetota bacterium]